MENERWREGFGVFELGVMMGRGSFCWFLWFFDFLFFFHVGISDRACGVGGIYI